MISALFNLSKFRMTHLRCFTWLSFNVGAEEIVVHVLAIAERAQRINKLLIEHLTALTTSFGKNPSHTALKHRH